ncbi:MAG TPA: symmetrical bis(5'-nucleosyl)-tetraphosphatase [Gammaproteobacteria bacterium]
MAVFAIGDVQGCFDELQRLLDKLNFDPDKDRLWFTGDLVNRGPKSLETLRFVRDLGDGAISVLGNHDLHLLAVAEGFQAERPRDTMRTVLDAPDASELLNWLRHRPLAHYDAALGYLLVHGGLPPEWNLDAALDAAREVESELRGANYRDLLRDMYGNEPARWSEDLAGTERRRYIINAFTRIRYCTADGQLDFTHKGPPGSQPPDLLPWFSVPGRENAELDVLFGHWSTLRDSKTPRAFALDTGCLWGGKLTALRIDGEERLRVSVGCEQNAEK